MTDQQLLDLTKQLVAIESTTHNPDALREALEFIANFVRAHCKNVTVEYFESGGKRSFLAYKGTERPAQFHIILNGHVDVVPGRPEQYQAEIKDGKLYGRGVYDMKAACMVLASLFCEFVEQVPFALGLQIVTDEESAGRHGTLYQVQQGVRSDFVICGECGRATDTHEIANAAKGIIVAEIGFSGRAAHGAYPWKGDNAAMHAYHFIQKLHKFYPTPSEAINETTATVTSITAHSDAHTKIPDQAVVKLDIRYTADDPNVSTPEKFAALLHRLDPNAKIVAQHDFSSPLYSDPHNPLLLSLKASAEMIEGATFKFVQRHATSDGRFYGDVGNQACEFGIAGEHQHGDGEFVTIEAFSNYRATLHDFLRRTATAYPTGRPISVPQKQLAYS